MKYIAAIKRNRILILLLVLASALRLYKADFQSIWVDEVLTMNAANPNLTLKQFYDGILFWEYIPHLYFLLNRIAFEIFGFSTLVARILSAIIGVLGVYAIYLLGRAVYSKKAGLTAAFLLSVNIFHIYYSQDMRPYGMLFLFTVLSFYRLVLFLKNPSVKNAIYYGIFTGLILHAHFFGLITIFSQCVLLLYFLIISGKENKGRFLKLSVLGGITALVVFIPVIKPFIRVSGISSFWLEPPKADVFTQMFREFFGNSEMVLFIINFIVIYYAVNLFKEKVRNYNYEGILGNGLVSGFIIFFVWLSISLLIPLLKSYLDIPMLLIRYFSNILPVLILVIAIGICLIKNKIVKGIVILSLLCFSLVDIIVVHDYYNRVTKTQLREITNDIKAKNTEKADVVTYWSWIFKHFFENDPLTQIKEYTLDGYVDEMKIGNISNRSFWYIDANWRPYSVNDVTKAYLEQNFVLKEKLIYYDTWAHYYEAIHSDITTIAKIDIDKYTEAADNEIKYRLENFGYSDMYIKASGWAFIEGSTTEGAIISVVLINENKECFVIPTDTARRDDVSEYFNEQLPFSGFYANGSLKGLKKGTYKVGILIKDNNKEGFVITDKFIER